MKKLDTKKEMAKILNDSEDFLKEHNVNLKEDIFSVVQPFENGHAIVVEIDENDNGERTLKYKVNDSTFILPKKSGLLDFFCKK